MPSLPIEVEQYLAEKDFSSHTIRAVKSDLAKLVVWFEQANGERFDLKRITVRDVADFREHLQSVRRQSIATVNRALVSIRAFLGFLVKSGALPGGNPAESVKQLRRMVTVPRGLTVAQVRKVMREVELRHDLRSAAVLGLMLHAGLRVSEFVGLELGDAEINRRSGQVVIRRGKGNKQRIVPLSVEARRLLSAYLECRPPVDSEAVFVGERGPLTDDGVRAICNKYSAVSGFKFTPHVLRHTFAHRYLRQTNNDLVGLAQILGHENLNTTAIYTKRNQDDLQNSVDLMCYE